VKARISGPITQSKLKIVNFLDTLEISRNNKMDGNGTYWCPYGSKYVGEFKSKQA
jgi:hypothetical protein